MSYQVVADSFGRTSLWPLDRPLPTGWQVAGPSGSEAECLNHLRAMNTSLDRQLIPPADGLCLHEQFASVAQRWPDRTAVSDTVTSLSYAELDRRSNQLAHRLQSLGAGPEMLVGLCIERSVELIVGLLGILKAGAGYLPLDPRYPLERLRTTVGDAGCRLVVGTMVPDVLLLDPLEAGLSEQPGTPPTSDVHPNNLAYVIYTSGSTGRPKGVLVSHQNVSRLFTATAAQFQPARTDVWTMFHSVAFDFSVWEVWGALLAGGRVVVVPYDLSRDPDAFLRLLRQERVTMLSQTPTAFRQLIGAAARAGFPDTSLRTVVFGGEQLRPETLRGWIERYGDQAPELVNMYGITETTVHVTQRRITMADTRSSRSPIGVALPDLTVHLLDDELRPVPPGQPGEIYVGGPGVARGYHGAADLSAQRFLPDPFTADGGALYRSGDLAERDHTGELVYHGRVDNQLQLRGFRIEPAEIESVIGSHPCVRDVAIALHTDQHDHQQLVCYWVPAGPGEPDQITAGLQQLVAGTLPAHLRPSAYLAVPELPMTANGKLDLEALPAPRQAPSDPDGLVATGAVQQVLIAIWSQLLGIDDLGIEEDFFEVGGDSISAISLVANARAAGIPLSIQLLFAHPTIAELTAALSRDGANR